MLGLRVVRGWFAACVPFSGTANLDTASVANPAQSRRNAQALPEHRDGSILGITFALCHVVVTDFVRQRLTGAGTMKLTMFKHSPPL